MVIADIQLRADSKTQTIRKKTMARPTPRGGILLLLMLIGSCHAKIDARVSLLGSPSDRRQGHPATQKRHLLLAVHVVIDCFLSKEMFSFPVSLSHPQVLIYRSNSLKCGVSA